MQTNAAAWGTQNMVLQGFFVRAGADTSPTEASFGYTYRRDTVATIGGPQFIATLYEAEPVALLNSNYSVHSSTVKAKLQGSLHGLGTSSPYGMVKGTRSSRPSLHYYACAATFCLYCAHSLGQCVPAEQAAQFLLLS